MISFRDFTICFSTCEGFSLTVSLYGRTITNPDILYYHSTATGNWRLLTHRCGTPTIDNWTEKWCYRHVPSRYVAASYKLYIRCVEHIPDPTLYSQHYVKQEWRDLHSSLCRFVVRYTLCTGAFLYVRERSFMYVTVSYWNLISFVIKVFWQDGMEMWEGEGSAVRKIYCTGSSCT